MWMASRTREEVLSAFAEHEAVIGPMDLVADAMADEHLVRAEARVRGLGAVRSKTLELQAVVPRLLGHARRDAPGLGARARSRSSGPSSWRLGHAGEALARLARQTGSSA